MSTSPRDSAISWDECFMRMALTIAQRSKDPSTQAGAVITTPEHIVVGMGYNGFPRGIDSNEFPWERAGELHETKYAYICHSEENAIYNANSKTSGCKVYTTLFPCNECAKTLIQNGITEVIYQSDKYHDLPAWKASRKMFDAVGVSYRQYISSWETEEHICLK